MYDCFPRLTAVGLQERRPQQPNLSASLMIPFQPPKAVDPPPAAAAPIEQAPVKSTEMNSSAANSSGDDVSLSPPAEEMVSSHMEVDGEALGSHSQPSSFVEGKHPSPDMSEADNDEDLILIIPPSGDADQRSGSAQHQVYEDSNASEISGAFHFNLSMLRGLLYGLSLHFFCIYHRSTRIFVST